MAESLVQELVESGIHFGQRTSNWNPKMGRFIYGKRNGIHIIDLRETIKGLLLAKRLLTKVVAEGKDVCFVGTKRQARPVLETRVPEVKMHYVIERWLGGTLTNFRTIRSRLKRLEELEAIAEKDNFASYSKKMESRLRREMRKIRRNLEGVRRMSKLPGAVVVIDVKREVNALREARKLGIPTICLIDTDGDPDQADIGIPGNDDSMRSIDVIVRELCSAIIDGMQGREIKRESDESAAAGVTGDGARPADARTPKRRSSRAKYRADQPAAGEAGPEAAIAANPAVEPAATPAAEHAAAQTTESSVIVGATEKTATE